MGSPEYTIRRPLESDRQQWESLWQAYVIFYEASLPDEITTVLWQRIHDYQHPINCFVAEQTDTGEVIGFVNYFPHPGTWHKRFSCYLEDLFVSPGVRGGGIGQALIKTVTDEAKKQGWAEVYWHTKENNSVARGLYDKMTGGTDGFIVYRVEFDS